MSTTTPPAPDTRRVSPAAAALIKHAEAHGATPEQLENLICKHALLEPARPVSEREEAIEKKAFWLLEKELYPMMWEDASPALQQKYRLRATVLVPA
jgi:hypothetical protein